MRVYLCDLIHTAARYRTFPYGAGCVASYARAQLGAALEVELFRTVEDLDAALARAAPEVVGFSHYIWNACLSDEVAKRLRARLPGIVIVIGGPNYPATGDEQRAYLERRPAVDFAVAAEGEAAFAGLLRALAAPETRADAPALPGVQYLRGGSLVAGPPAPRLASLDEVPSPYLTGLFDKFFALGGYSPLTQTKRGCPFACTFCVEGLPAYNEVAAGSADRFEAELEYMAARLRAPEVLQLADANFGMYREDLEACRRIGRVRRARGWPVQIEVSTGKNHKERIVEAVQLTDGAFRLCAALQSTHAETLRNIKRSNISLAELLSVAQRSRELGQRSYAELILGLPGDDRAAYMASIRTCIEAGLDRVQLYPLILLPGTELASGDTRRRFRLRTSRRPLPHAAGDYAMFGERFRVQEIVDGVIETADMPFEDYLACRAFGLSVEVFYNDGYFAEVQGLLRHLGSSMFDFVARCHERAGAGVAPLHALYRALDSAVRAEAGAGGAQDAAGRRWQPTASLGVLKGIAISEHAAAVHEIALAALLDQLAAAGAGAQAIDYARQLMAFSLQRKEALLDDECERTGRFDFDFVRLAGQGFDGDPAVIRLAEPVEIRFWHTPEQRADLNAIARRHQDPAQRGLALAFPRLAQHVTPMFRNVAPAADGNPEEARD